MCVFCACVHPKEVSGEDLLDVVADGTIVKPEARVKAEDNRTGDDENQVWKKPGSNSNTAGKDGGDGGSGSGSGRNPSKKRPLQQGDRTRLGDSDDNNGDDGAGVGTGGSSSGGGASEAAMYLGDRAGSGSDEDGHTDRGAQRTRRRRAKKKPAVATVVRAHESAVGDGGSAGGSGSGAEATVRSGDNSKKVRFRPSVATVALRAHGRLPSVLLFCSLVVFWWAAVVNWRMSCSFPRGILGWCFLIERCGTRTGDTRLFV